MEASSNGMSKYHADGHVVQQDDEAIEPRVQGLVGDVGKRQSQNADPFVPCELRMDHISAQASSAHGP